MSAARDAILGDVRRQLASARAPELPPVSHEGWTPPADLAAHFRERLLGVGVKLHEARDEAEAAAALAQIVRQHGARRVAVSDAELARRVASTCGEPLELLALDAPRAELLEADLGLSCAQHGVAETGTLALASSAERHRLVSLLPPVHVALFPMERLVPSLGDLLARVSAAGPAAMSRALTLITGPSRTADIELKIVVGVHGPKVLHVVLLGATVQPSA